MELTDELLEAINLFEKYVFATDKIFRSTYIEDLDPYSAKGKGLIPKTGTLQIEQGELQYNFHGAGVWAKYPDGTEVDYDYYFATGRKEGQEFIPLYFDRYKFLQFVASSPIPTQLPTRDWLDEATIGVFDNAINIMLKFGMLQVEGSWRLTKDAADWALSNARKFGDQATPEEFRFYCLFLFPGA